MREKIERNQDLVVINVLPEKYYKDCHIAGSISVPLKEIIYLAKDWEKSQEIVVYCALDECDAGEKAYILLKCMDFQTVYDYPGGINEWYQLGYEVAGPCASWYLHEKIGTKAKEICALSEDFDFKDALKRTRYIKCFGKHR